MAVLSVMAFHADPRLMPGGFAGVGADSSCFRLPDLVDGHRRARAQRDFSFATSWRTARLVPATGRRARRGVRRSPDGSRCCRPNTKKSYKHFMLPQSAIVSQHRAGGGRLLRHWRPTSSRCCTTSWSAGGGRNSSTCSGLPCSRWRGAARVNLLAVIAFVGGASFAANIVTIQSDPSAAFYLPPSLLAVAGRRHGGCRLKGGLVEALPLPRWWPALACGLAGVGVGTGGGVHGAAGGRDLLTHRRRTLPPDGGRSLPTAWAVVGVAAGPEALFNPVHASPWPLLVLVGVISYPAVSVALAALAAGRARLVGDARWQTRRARVRRRGAAGSG